MGRAIDLDQAIEIIEEKQKELCPVGRYGRHYVYGSDREKYDAWEEIIDALDALPTLPQPSNEALTCTGCVYRKREGWNYEQCVRCKRHWGDRYRRPPEGEEEA